MYIDPANASSMQPALAHEGNNVAVRHDRRLMHLLVVCEKLPASTDIANEQLTKHELMATHLVAVQ